MQLTIRPANAADSMAIAGIAAATFHIACPPTTPRSEIDAYILSSLLPVNFAAHIECPSKRVLVMECNGIPVGYSLLDLEPAPLSAPLDLTSLNDATELTRCYVLPEQHGNGAAQILFEHTIRLTQRSVRLTVSEENARAIRFYEKNGFTTVGNTDFVCGDEIHRDLVLLRPRA